MRTLKNQLSSSHIAHAYLFCGSRGTGKTSTAKIFARAINCMSPTEYGPCRECKACLNLSSESNMDIVEIDAASNNGVDEIRDLRDKVRFPPSIGKFKVYIIDEVHMLSMGAFNALLKTLEEPPSHVVFILATTEPHKLPATILSRCQRFDFKRITQKVLVDRMQSICNNMDVMIEENGLQTIARWAEGGMRDALSLLDQCMSFCGDHITNNDILNILGTTDQDFLFQVTDHILDGNLQQMLHKIGRLLEDGKDLNVFLRDLLHHIRNLLIVKSCDHPESLLDVAQSTLKQLKNQAKQAGEARLIRSIELLSPLEFEMRHSSQPRVLLELVAVKLCRPQQEASLEALMDRVELLEKKLRSGANVPLSVPPLSTREVEISYAAAIDQPYDPAMDPSMLPPPPEVQDDTLPEREQTTKTKSSESSRREPEAKLPNNRLQNERSSAKSGTNSTALGDPVIAWPSILDTISQERPSIHVTLVDARPRLEKNGVFTLVFPPSLGFHVLIIEQENNRTFIENMVEKATGQRVRVKCLLEDQVGEQAAPDEDYVVKKAIEVFGENLVEVVDED